MEPKRALSFFVHPNFYALWCAPLLAFLIPDLFSSIKNKGLKIKDIFVNRKSLIVNCIKPLAWLLGAIGLFLSMSRAGWLGLAAALGIYLIVAADKKIKKMILYAGNSCCCYYLRRPQLPLPRIASVLWEKSTVSRFSLWTTGLKGIKESPILGLGLTGFSNQWNTLNTDPNLDTHNFPHNIFLDFWLETGLLGLISIMILISLYLYRGFRSIVIARSASDDLSADALAKAEAIPSQSRSPRSPEGSLAMTTGDNLQKIIPLSIALFLIALLVQACEADNPYFKNDLALVFWMILALT